MGKNSCISFIICWIFHRLHQQILFAFHPISLYSSQLQCREKWKSRSWNKNLKVEFSAIDRQYCVNDWGESHVSRHLAISHIYLRPALLIVSSICSWQCIYSNPRGHVTCSLQPGTNLNLNANLVEHNFWRDTIKHWILHNRYPIKPIWRADNLVPIIENETHEIFSVLIRVSICP